MTLRPCRTCGTAPKFKSSQADTLKHFYYCPKCATTDGTCDIGPLADTPEEAAALWNEIHAPEPEPERTVCPKCGKPKACIDPCAFGYEAVLGKERRYFCMECDAITATEYKEEDDPVTPARKLMNHIAGLIESGDYTDERTLALIAAELRADAPEDVAAYDRAAAECRAVFIERRAQYGAHTGKHAAYDVANLYGKACRLCADHEAGREIKRDTVLDLANFAQMLLSRSK